MADSRGRDLLHEWRELMDAVVGSAESVAGRAPLPGQVSSLMQRQLDLLQEVVERERHVQREVLGRLVAPVDAVFDLLAESGEAMRKQAESLQAAGRALQDSAALVKMQADLFERMIAALREPTELAKAAAGVERRGRKQSSAKPRRAKRS